MKNDFLCPTCSQEISELSDLEIGAFDNFFYEFFCENCGLSGKIWFELSYIKTTIG